MVQGSPNIPDNNAGFKISTPAPVTPQKHKSATLVPTQTNLAPTDRVQISAAVGASKPHAVSDASAPAAIAPADSVQISPAAQQVSQLKAQLDALPEIRPDRVAQVTAQLSQLSSGGTELNAKIAEKLLTEL